MSARSTATEAAAAASAIADAAKKAPPGVTVKWFSIVSIVLIVVVFIWASWLAPWAKSGIALAAPQPVQQAPPTAAALEILAVEVRALREDVRAQGLRIDRMLELLTKKTGN